VVSPSIAPEGESKADIPQAIAAPIVTPPAAEIENAVKPSVDSPPSQPEPSSAPNTLDEAAGEANKATDEIINEATPTE
jgi:hypothetical protein